MDFSAALPTFVVTLREGVEAALVVGIVLACLKKAEQSQLNQWVYAGVGVGIAASVLVGVLFTWTIATIGAANPLYTPVVEPLLEVGFSIIAIAMLSWMLVWMTQQAKFLKTEVEGSVTAALKNSSGGWGVFTLILIAVLREGFETVLFIAANFQQGLTPALGALAGLAGAVGIGVLLFKWGVKINIRLFFQAMGIFLLLIVAGLVVSALKNLNGAAASLSQIDPQFGSLCFYSDHFAKNPSCILGPMVWDTSNVLPDKKFPGVILKALFGYREKLYLVQAVSYIVFLLTVGSLYFRSLGSQVSNSAQNQPTS